MAGEDAKKGFYNKVKYTTSLVPSDMYYDGFEAKLKSDPTYLKQVYDAMSKAKEEGRLTKLADYNTIADAFGLASTTPTTTTETKTSEVPGSGGSFPTMEELNTPISNQPLPNTGGIGTPTNQPKATPAENQIAPLDQQAGQVQGGMPQGQGLGAGQFQITDTRTQAEKPQSVPTMPIMEPIKQTTTAPTGQETALTSPPSEQVGYFDYLGNAVQRGLNRGEIADYIGATGKTPTAEEFRRIAELNAENERLFTSKAMEDFANNPDFESTLKSLPEIAIESIASLYRHGLARMATGAVTGGIAGSVVPVIGTISGAGTGTLSGMTVAGLGLEVSGTIIEGLNELKINTKDPNALKTAFSNPAVMNYLKQKAYARGIPIAALDAVSMGVAGKFLGKPVMSSVGRGFQVLGEAGIQGGLGATGELLAQINSGEKIKGYEILAEGLAEIPGSVPEVAIAVMSKNKSTGGNTKADAARLVANNPNISGESVGEMVDVGVGSGEITAQQADEIKSDVNKANEINAKIPAEIKDTEFRVAAIGLIEEREGLQAQLETVDEAFKPAIQQKIKAINEQLQVLGTVPPTTETQGYFETNKPSVTNPIVTMPTIIDEVFEKIDNGILVSSESLYEVSNAVNQAIRATLNNQALSPAEKGATLNILSGMLADIDKANTEGQKFVDEVEAVSVQDRVPAVREGVKPLPAGQEPKGQATITPKGQGESIRQARRVRDGGNQGQGGQASSQLRTQEAGQAQANAEGEVTTGTPEALADVEDISKNIETAKADGGFRATTYNAVDVRTVTETSKLFDNGVVVYRKKDSKNNTWVVAVVGYEQFGGRTGYTMAMIEDNGNLPNNVEDALILKAAEDWFNSPRFMEDNKATQASKDNADRVRPMIEAKVKEIKERQKTQGGQYAVQKQSTAKVPVQPKAGVSPEVADGKPKPNKIKVLGKDMNMYSNYIPSKVEDVEPNAIYTFSADSKDGIPAGLRDVASVNTSEINGVKKETWSASINGDELIKQYPTTPSQPQQVQETPDALVDVESTANVQMPDDKLQEIVGRDVFKEIQRAENQLGEGIVDRNRMIETAKQIQKVDKKDKLLPEHIFEALQYEIGFPDNWQDLRNAIEKGGIDLNSEAVQRQIEVGVKLPKDIVEKFKESKQYKNATPELVKAVEELLTPKSDAVQKQIPAKVPVQPEAGVSPEVAEGKPQAKPESPAQQGKGETTATEAKGGQEVVEGETKTYEVFRGQDEDYEVGEYDGTYGKGKYYTGDKKSAKVYGKNVTSHKVELSNPFIIKGTRVEGVPLEGMKDYINENVIPKGYDGVILLDAKGNIFELVKFETKATTQPTITPITATESKGEVVEGEIKKQIENFGVAPNMVEPVNSVISKIFDGLKNAGLTTAKTVGEWVGIGKGKESVEALKQQNVKKYNEIEAEKAEIIKKAKANGTYHKAPNGKKSNLSENQWANVRTKNFKNWFGDWENDPSNASKAVDKNGEPKLLWHGSSQNFEEFDVNKLGENTGAESAKKGIFFSDNKDVANSYRRAYIIDNPNLQELKNILNSLSVPEILKINKETFGYNAEQYEGESKQEIIDDIIREIESDSQGYYEDRNKYVEKASESLERMGVLFNPYIELGNVYEVFLNIKNPELIDAQEDQAEDVGLSENIENAKSNGNDGVFVKDIYDSITFEYKGNDSQLSNIYVAFNPNQIKSATNNSGDYSSNTGSMLFKDSQAQYRIESGKNIVEAIKDFNGTPEATVALTHEIMHPTVVSIIDGAKDGNEVGKKHTQTILSEYNKANPDNKVSTQELVADNDKFKAGETTDKYRAVQEFVAESWEKYNTEGGKGFSKSFQDVLDQITKAFQSVYKSLSGKELTPELRVMFDEILGKQPTTTQPTLTPINATDVAQVEKIEKAPEKGRELALAKPTNKELKRAFDNSQDLSDRARKAGIYDGKTLKIGGQEITLDTPAKFKAFLLNDGNYKALSEAVKDVKTTNPVEAKKEFKEKAQKSREEAKAKAEQAQKAFDETMSGLEDVKTEAKENVEKLSESNKDSDITLQSGVDVKQILKVPEAAMKLMNWGDNLVAKITVPIQEYAAKQVRKAMRLKYRAASQAANISQGFLKNLASTEKGIDQRRRFIGGVKNAAVVALEFYEKAVDVVGGNPQSLMRVHQVLDPELYQSKVDVKGIPKVEESDLTPNEKILLDLLRKNLDFIHEWHYANGFISEETYEKNKGNYSPRFWEMETQEDPELSVMYQQMGKSVNRKYIKQRQELDDMMKDADDAIQDPVFGTAMRMAQTLRNKAVVDYANQVLQTDAVHKGSEPPPPGYILLEGPRYGPLNGKYVARDIAEDFKGYFLTNEIANQAYRLGRLIDAMPATQFLKKAKTVYEAGVFLGNIIGNLTFGFKAGVDPFNMMSNIDAANKDIDSRGADYKHLLKEGVLGTDILTEELRKKSESVRLMGKTISTGTPPNANPLTGKANGVIGKIGDVMEGVEKWYGKVDDIAKVAAYKALRNQGMSVDEATRRVFEGFQNNNMVGRYYDVAAKTPVVGNRYVKFKGDSLRRNKNNWTKRPLTSIAYFSLLSASISALSKYWGKEDEDETKARTALAFKPKVDFAEPLNKLGVPDISLTFQSPYGEVNVARMLGTDYLYDAGEREYGGDLEEWSQNFPFQVKYAEDKDSPIPIGPAFNDVLFGPIAQLANNRDFRNKRILDPTATIYTPGRESTFDMAVNAVKFLANAYVPYYGKGESMYSAITDQPDQYERVRDVPQSLINNFIKIQEVRKPEIIESYKKDLTIIFNQIDGLDKDMSSIRNRAVDDIAKYITNDKLSQEYKDEKSKKIYDQVMEKYAETEDRKAKMYERALKKFRLVKPLITKP